MQPLMRKALEALESVLFLCFDGVLFVTNIFMIHSSVVTHIGNDYTSHRKGDLYTF